MIARALAAGLVFALTAAGAEAQTYGEEGTRYVSLSGVAGFDDFDDEIGDPTDRRGLPMVGTSDPDVGGGLQGRFGVRATKYFAAELFYQWIESFDVKHFDPILGIRSRSLESHLISFNAKVLPLQGRIQPYGTLGAGLLIVKGSGIQTPLGLTGRFGAGVDVYLNDEWSVNVIDAAYVLPSLNVDGFDFWTLSAGVTYHFF